LKKNITVLGIHFWHDAGAALVQNGKVIAAINEERITNIKHYAGYPIESIKEVLRISKIHPSEIDAIAVVGTADLKFPKNFERFPNFSHAILDWSWQNSNQKDLEVLYLYHKRIQKVKGFSDVLAKLGISSKQVFFIEHHLAHASCAYHLSQWNIDERVLVLTSDGVGDGLSSTVSIGHNGELDRIENSETSQDNSLGEFYASVTGYLGMNYSFDAFKVMGLAPYGKSSYCLDKIKKIIDVDDVNPLKFKNNMNSFKPALGIELRKILRGQRFDNVAAAAQEWLEILKEKWIKNAIEETGIHKIACAGGNFLNVKANQKLLALEEVDDAFFCPAAGDEGLAVGAALVGYYEMSIMSGRKPENVPLKDAYFGSSFSNEEIEESLKKHHLLDKAEYIDDIDVAVGELLAKDSNIVARFSGQMEWGPRGLGNRSIIANPSDHAVVRKINHAIKMRDFWMPFGPSILESRMQDYVVNPINAPYMILAFDTTEKRNEMTAAIHPYDLTCRPQTVSSDYNPGYEKVLKSFENKTGIGAVLNTSFNLHGNPIVWSPEIAIDTFNNSELDVIALGNYLLKK
jgi:carbamoyltransferase